MGKLQSIENAVAAINGAKFQALCDSFLALRNQNYRAFSRLGSQSGKEKTVKGTPDSFLLLPDGNYILVEYSTNVTAGIKKIQEDIEKCVDETKTGIPTGRISEIIICLNFNIKTEDVEALRKTLKTTGIHLTIETLDSLSLEINLHHRNLAHEYLGLSFDSGQVVSIDQFIQEYSRKGAEIGTPLDNPFVERESEQESLSKALNTSDLIIVTGAPGVGKSKLCLENIKAFLSEHLSFEAYCISYKSHVLLDDLYSYLDADKNYVLFVDDANRIDAFSQIIGFYQTVRAGQLKIVVTVRDYAYTEVRSQIQEFDYLRIDIEKLKDEQIEKIIKGPPFKILNPDYHEPIIRIADGNPRLAIMASLLAKKEQSPYALRDVSDLFEKYYATFIKDQGQFANDLNIKCLGLIAFFFTIPYKDKETTEPILNPFGISYEAFIETIEELDRLELVEVQFEHVKIPEQNLGIYFFYKAFIQDQLLSFKTLLSQYFHKNPGRFKDCVIPANNTFGYERVMKILQPFLKSYWETAELNWEQGYKFLSTFWFYMQEETLAFVWNRILEWPIPDMVKYSVDYKTNDFTFNREKIIDLLGDFMRFSSTMDDALEILFEFVRRKPEHLAELIYEVRDTLLFDRDDYMQGFTRQFKLFQFLIDGVKTGDRLIAKAFFELAKTFLGFRFQHSKGGRNNSIVIYDFQIPDEESVHKFRQLVWETVCAYFEEYEDWAFEVLDSYSRMKPDVVKEIMEKDLPTVLQIIDRHLVPKDFEHCRYVQTQICWCRRNSVDHNSFPELSRNFTNRLYQRYLTLNWDRLRDKESFDFEDYDEYERLKEQQIRDSIKLTSEADVRQFYQDFMFLKVVSRNEWQYNNVLEMVIDETSQNDEDLGYFFLEVIMENGNEVELVPRKLLVNFMQNGSQAKRLWKAINDRNYKWRAEWKIRFFLNLPKHLRKREHAQSIVHAVQEIDYSLMISIGQFERFSEFDSGLLQKIISTIFYKNEKEGVCVTVWKEVFSEHFDKLGGDLQLIKKFYVQQRRIQNHFDHSLKGLKRIIEEDSGFLVEYIEGLYVEEKHGFLDDHKPLDFVWDQPDAEDIVKQIFDLVRYKAGWFGISEHYCGTFFKSLSPRHQSRADEFLIHFVKHNFSEPKKINEVVDIVRHHRRQLLPTILKTYVGLNQNSEDFSKIQWIGNGGTYNGDTIVGDVRAAGWKNILSIIEKANLGVKALKIKLWLKDQIRGELAYADHERRRMFVERH